MSGATTPPGSETGPAPGPGGHLAIGFILVTLVLDTIGMGIVMPVIPALVEEMAEDAGASAASWVGWIGASYALMQFAFSPLLGSLSDRFGRRPVILVALLGLSFDYAVLALAPTLPLLLLGRLVGGALGANAATCSAWIADVSTDETRGRNFGLMGASFAVGFVLGPAIGGTLGAIDLRLPFWLAGALTLLGALWGLLVLPESLPREERASLRADKLDPFRAIYALRDFPGITGLALVHLLLAITQSGLGSVWVLYTGYRYGWDEMTNGFALMAYGLVMVGVQGGLVGPTIRRFGARRTLVVGLAVRAIGYGTAGLAWEGWMMLGAVFGTAIGDLAGPALQSEIASRVERSSQGRVQGSLRAIASLGAVMAPIVFTAWVFAGFTGADAILEIPGAPFYLSMLMLLVGAGVAQRSLQEPADGATEEPASASSEARPAASGE